MKCDSCGAPVENGKCTYCGKTFYEQPKQPQGSVNRNTYANVNYSQNRNVNTPPVKKKKKSGCGTALWIFIIIMVIGGIVSLFSDDSSGDSSSEKAVESVWASDFAPIDDFDYYVDGTELYLKDYSGKDKKVKINNTYTIDGADYNVVSLDGTFALTRVDSVIVPNGVTYVSNNVFNSCGISFVYLPATLSEINNNFLGYFHDMDKIYYGGSEEQWNSLVTSERSDIDAKQIVFDAKISDLSPSTESTTDSATNDNTDEVLTAETATSISINDRLMEIGYNSEEATEIAEILTNVGILDADDMWVIMPNNPLQANALMYNGHQINFTTENGVLFYVEATGWDEEISHYGWYQSAWDGKMKYGYNTETKKASIDLYSVDSDGSGGYLAIYDIADDSVHPYKE